MPCRSLQNTKTFNLMYYDIVNLLLYEIFYLVTMTLIAKWYVKKAKLSRYFLGYVARIFAIDCYYWCFIAIAAIVIAVYLVGVFVVSVIGLPRSVLRHVVSPCIALRVRVNGCAPYENKFDLKSEALVVNDSHITLQSDWPIDYFKNQCSQIGVL